MTFRRVMTFATTTVVALVVALAVPVSQLRTVAVVKACCCPDPDNCHCPDHKPDHSGQSQMRACHNTTQVIVAPEAPAFTDTAELVVAAPVVVAAAPSVSLTSPHDPPPPARPAAPS